MDPLFLAYSCYRQKKLKDATDICTNILEKNPYDQAAWILKAKTLTAQVYIDEVDVDEEGIAEISMDDNTIANVAHPGTSLRRAGDLTGFGHCIRPTSQSGRPLSGFMRLDSKGGQHLTLEQAIRTPRTAYTARPVSSATGRFVRMGTASMLSKSEGPFINLAQLNLSKYAACNNLSKALFEYIFHHENDIRNALDFATLAIEANNFKSWWWKVQLAKCYYRLGMYRDAEKQLMSSLKDQAMVETFLYMGKVYARMDQPISSVQSFERGLKIFPGETTLLTGIARIHEGLADMEKSFKFYKDVLLFDSMHVESIAYIATEYFYTDQPEVALKYYRRLLQIGVYNAELFNNLGLCCFYAQQYDMTLTCFQRALSLGDELTMADIWYNIGHVALGLCDDNLAYQCFRLTLANNSDHAEAYNNLGVLELKRGHTGTAQAFFQASFVMAPHLYEPHYNYASLMDKAGDLQSSYVSAKRAVNVFPKHADSNDLLKRLQDAFSRL